MWPGHSSDLLKLSNRLVSLLLLGNLASLRARRAQGLQGRKNLKDRATAGSIARVESLIITCLAF